MDSLHNVGEKATYFEAGDKHEFDPERWMSLPASSDNGSSGSNSKYDSHTSLPKADMKTHLKVLIVGAGYAGLMVALECWRKGHDVVGILERNDGPNYSGDLIIIQPSALAVMRHWPQMWRELEEDRVTASTYYYRHNGELLDGPAEPTFNDPEHVAERESKPGGFPPCSIVQIRKKFYRMLLRQVARLGFKVEYGQRVNTYFEDETAGLAGVIMSDASVRTAHVVVAADGSRSSSELLIAGEYVPTQSSGMSVYRTSYPGKLAFANEMVRQRWGGRSSHEFWLGTDMHIGLYLSPDLVAFGITPRDKFLGPSQIARDTWDPDTDPEEVIEVMRRAARGIDPASETESPDPSNSNADDWHPVIEALVRTAPRGSLIHWPLRWRNLRRDWVSTTGRVVQIGDAAHSTVPASAAGGTLALEDAITLAACLQVASGPDRSVCAAGAGAPLGTRIYNLLRYERTSCTQKMAFVNAQVLGQTTDWDAVRSNPKQVRLRFPKWFFRHDPEAYVYEKYGQAFAHLVSNSTFQNTNIPPGHKFVHWTLENIHQKIANGMRVEELLDGDWS